MELWMMSYRYTMALCCVISALDSIPLINPHYFVRLITSITTTIENSLHIGLNFYFHLYNSGDIYTDKRIYLT